MNALKSPDVSAPPTPPPLERRSRDRTRVFAWAIFAVASIWLSVVVISIFSPDLISGTEQDHVPLAAILTWIWGASATKAIVGTVAKPENWQAEGVRATALLSLAVSGVWYAAIFTSVFGPVMITGTDPTHLPLAAIISPIGAMVITQVACQLYTAFGRSAD